MPTARSSSYSVASGGGVYAGIASPLPSWRAGAGLLEWREIPGSAMSLTPPTVNPGSKNAAAKVEAWNGLSMDTRTCVVWGLAMGGHGDYWGNEVMQCNLMLSTCPWVEMIPSSVAADVTVESARYLDGKPPSAHGYYGQQFMERHNRAVRVGGSYSGSGAGFDVMEGWDSTVAAGVNGWDALGTYPPFSGIGGSQVQIDVPIAKHPTTEELFLVYAQNGYLRKFTPNASTPGGSWSTVGNPLSPPIVPFDSNGGACAIDTVRNRMMVTHGSATAGAMVTEPYTVDLSTGVWTAHTYQASAATTELKTLQSAPGMVYVPSEDAYYLRGSASGGRVFRIDAGTFDVTKPTTTGGSSVPAAPFLNFAPFKNYENIYTRWLLAPLLGGVVYFPGYTSNGWFLRLF